MPKADKVNAKTSDYLVLNMAVALVYKIEDNAEIQPNPAFCRIIDLISRLTTNFILVDRDNSHRRQRALTTSLLFTKYYALLLLTTIISHFWVFSHWCDIA